MADSSIEWTDKVWNPTLGCLRVSADCGGADEGGCYAERLAFRLAAMGKSEYQGLTHRLPDGKVRWTGKVICLPERLEQPLKWKKPARIFVDSMSDLFHEDVPDEFLVQVFRTMLRAHWHTFQVLTKRPERMRQFVWNWHFALDEWKMPANIWLGVSVEDQRAADERVPLLLQTPAAVRFLSVEPMLGPVELDDWLKVRKHWKAEDNIGHAPWHPPYPKHWYEPQALVLRDWQPPIQWVIAGGESGPHYRPMDLDWIRSLRDQCRAAGVPFFFKQAAGPRHGIGRELDGREWNEFPEVHSATLQSV